MPKIKPPIVVRIRFELPPEDRDRLGIAAARAGVRNMSTYTRRVMTDHLDRLDAKEARRKG